MRYCLTLDLYDDPLLIARYKLLHQQVWPEILESIRESGIKCMEIYNISTRLFMIIEVDETFSFERKRNMDIANKKVQEWEQLMDTYQKRLGFAKENQKWVLMENIFSYG
ncbi:MAG: L-rhamnose mutarotase [Bacteroidota bacterium]